MPLMFTKRQFPTPYLAFAPFLFATFAVRAAPSDVSVLNYEQIEPSFAMQSSGQQKASNTTNVMRFTAFGKNFVATLEPNAAISVPPSSVARAYRGSIEGQTNSWLR